MPRDVECVGAHLENAIDSVVDEVEKDVSAAAGKGLITEMQYDDVVRQISEIRTINDRLKCLMQKFPEVKTETTVEEIIKKEE